MRYLRQIGERALEQLDNTEGNPSFNPNFIRQTLSESTDERKDIHLILKEDIRDDGNHYTEIGFQVDEGGTHSTVHEVEVSGEDYMRAEEYAQAVCEAIEENRGVAVQKAEERPTGYQRQILAD